MTLCLSRRFCRAALPREQLLCDGCRDPELLGPNDFQPRFDLKKSALDWHGAGRNKHGTVKLLPRGQPMHLSTEIETQQFCLCYSRTRKKWFGVWQSVVVGVEGAEGCVRKARVRARPLRFARQMLVRPENRWAGSRGGSSGQLVAKDNLLQRENSPS